jgi:phage antirepressor YoqD-like protein
MSSRTQTEKVLATCLEAISAMNNSRAITMDVKVANDKLVTENKQLQDLNTDKQSAIKLMKEVLDEVEPAMSYLDSIRADKSSFRTITEIAKDYGMGPKRLNAILRVNRIQYRPKKGGDQPWMLYDEYVDKGYTTTDPYIVKDANGNTIKVVRTMVWLNDGQEFLYYKLKAIGVKPRVERVPGEGIPAKYKGPISRIYSDAGYGNSTVTGIADIHPADQDDNDAELKDY